MCNGNAGKYRVLFRWLDVVAKRRPKAGSRTVEGGDEGERASPGRQSYLARGLLAS